MRAETPTKLPLYTWAKIMGINPLHFGQVRLDITNSPDCSAIIFQHEWQNHDHVSREEIARAIFEAESKIERALGYRLAPSWEVDEWQPTVRNFRRELLNLNSADIAGFRQGLKADWGHFISGGIKAQTLVQANRPIVYDDADSDGYSEDAQVTATTVAMDPNEIAVFYPGKSGDPAWEIRPINVVIAAGTATIHFRREQAVIPEILDAMYLPQEDVSADGVDDDDFLTTVDVYRRYNDPQTQVSFLWEPGAGGFCNSCNGAGCAMCSYATQTGCLIVKGNPRNSLIGFAPADWDADENEFTSSAWAVGRQPDIIRLYYYAGWRDKAATYVSRMSRDWEITVARMAAAMLDRPACDCSSDTWDRWRQDLSLDSGDEDGKPIFRTPDGILDNPFGSRRGEVDAWRKVSSPLNPNGMPIGEAVRI